MIIEKPLSSGDTITIKTTAGEEIVARLVELKTNSYVVSKPLAVMATAQGIGLGPLAFTVNPETKIEIHTHAVLFVAKSDSEMAKQYVSSTSGLQLV
jgi:pterin-4a-carbinolamine dehydratase